VADPLRFLRAELDDLARKGLLRTPKAAAGINVCSNDYLGFAREPLVATASSGAGASALVLGHTQAHADAEADLAAWLGHEAALLFSSGYAANVGVLSALASPGDLVLSDRLNHASIIDGCRLSRASVSVFEHADTASLRALLQERRASFRRCVVVSESYFSMDGDAPDLRQIRALADEFDAALVIDEAHAIGVWGDAGRGRCQLEEVKPDVLVGTMGKALGLHGAFVAGSAELRAYLWNKARSFVFSTAIAPALAELVSLRVAAVSAAASRRARLFETAKAFRQALSLVSTAVLGQGPIIPWVLGNASRAAEGQSFLAARGVDGVAIRPPTVPSGAARLRLTAGAWMSAAEVATVCEVLSAAATELGHADA